MYRYYIVNRNGDGELSYPNTISATDLYLYGQNGVSFDCMRRVVYGYFECPEELDQWQVASYGLILGPIPTYYPINEELARQAHDMMSYYDYKKGSKTAEYRRCVDSVYMTA